MSASESLRGQQDDRAGDALLAQFAAQRAAVAVGQTHIQDHEFVQAFARALPRLRRRSPASTADSRPRAPSCSASELRSIASSSTSRTRLMLGMATPSGTVMPRALPGFGPAVYVRTVCLRPSTRIAKARAGSRQSAAEQALDRVVRAVEAFRRGAPVVRSPERRAEASLALGGRNRKRCGALRGLKPTESASASQLLTHARARTLKIRLYTPDVVAILPPRPARRRALARHRRSRRPISPSRMKGPFETLREKLPDGFAAAVKLAKLAGLLPVRRCQRRRTLARARSARSRPTTFAITKTRSSRR